MHPFGSRSSVTREARPGHKQPVNIARATRRCLRVGCVARTDGVGRARWQKMLHLNRVSTRTFSSWPSLSSDQRLTGALRDRRSARPPAPLDYDPPAAAGSTSPSGLMLALLLTAASNYFSLKLSDFTLQQRLAQLSDASSCRVSLRTPPMSGP